MIYLITGVPGSGKSLYAVAKLLQDLLKEKIKGANGEEIARRLCVDGIPDLVLPHELMAPGEKVRGADGKFELQPTATGNGIWNWQDWCKPGDVLCVDEVQRWWRPRGMGTKPPAAIAMLETHRHFGIDLVLITQNPMLLDQNVRRLVGRHMHVRRLFGTQRALIYDWDGCNTDTSRLGSGTRSLFTYDKKAFSLYKSSELHTKQRQSVPLFMWFPVVVLALGLFTGPKAYSTLRDAMTGKGVVKGQASQTVAAASGVVAPVPPTAGAGGAANGPAVVASGSVGGRTGPVDKPRLLGCIAFGPRCECFSESGERVDMPHAACEDASQRVSALPLIGGGGGAGRAAYKASDELACDSVDTGKAVEVRCGPKVAQAPLVLSSSDAPVQGVNAGSMAVQRGVGAVRPDSGKGAGQPTR